MRTVDIGTQNFTKVVAVDEKAFNANHEYVVIDKDTEIKSETGAFTYAKINFQKGPIKENGVNGCHNEDLIAIVIDRLQSFQESEYKCRENAIAITKLEEALLWLGKRTADRAKRGVEGTSKV